MKNTRKTTLLLLLLLGFLPLYGIPHNMRNLSTRDGLNDLLINVIHRDSSGLVIAHPCRSTLNSQLSTLNHQL